MSCCFYRPRAMPPVADTPGASAALELLRAAYGTRLKRPGRDPQHSVKVAELLFADGASAPVVVAGLLHDVLEDTEVTSDELRAVCGSEITRVVEALTEDPSIAKYRARKAALRARIVAAGPNVAMVSIADKLAKLQGVSAAPRKRKLRHYRATLDTMEQHYGPTDLSRQLARELARFA